MGYLDELLSRNPLVIDGDTIRPHHKYTDDLYTRGVKISMNKNIKQTNYDRIQSMSVEEMAQELTKAEAEGYESAIPMIYNAWKQWLEQEVS